MPDSLSHLTKPSLAYAKLVATPTATAWSQVYNAGNLFACLSLTVKEDEEGLSLPSLGKQLLSNLEAEFFTLEAKDIPSIKKAIAASREDIPASVSFNICLAFFKDSVLYLFLAGAGKVVMKRGETIGVLLEKHTGDNTQILTASGYLQSGDSIILQTHQFAQDISDTTLTSALELSLPNDIAEVISPELHAKGDGGQAAIIITAHGMGHDTTFEEESSTTDEEKEDELEEIDDASSNKKPFRFPILPRFFPSLRSPSFHLNHRKKFFLSIALVLILLLGVSIYLTKQQQEHSQSRILFESIYPPAQKSYEEGKGLENLNKTLSQEDFRKAQTLLQQAQGKFPTGSSEEKQINELLSKINAELETTAPVNLPKAKETNTGASSLLSAEMTNNGISFAQSNDTIYFITDKSVISVDEEGEKKDLIKNENDWSSAVALASYQGNVYVLDTKEGVLKFVAGGGGFGKTSYFKETVPDLRKAVALAIDSSIWILKSDGTILKYTSGKADSFKLTGLDQPLSDPTKLIATNTLTNMYVLDRGNSRVVVFSKDGSFKAQYGANVAATARDFDVSEKDKKIYMLANDKIWEILMK